MEDELKEEERKIRRMRFLINLTQSIIIQSDLSLREVLTLTEETKMAVLGLFPDKESVYDLIYAPRFSRLIYEKYGISKDLTDAIN
ncbi:MAG: hypothetical protein HZA77_10805 [Candidatus Schekmanbacteria bacterium]|nr:hypothetical protein [Candidatus Schekmanbacteria bacterium]